MNAKQTPLVDILRLHAEDLYSDYGHNKSARLLSQAADEIERLRSNSLALEAELAELRRFRKVIMDYDSNLYDALADSDAAHKGEGE